jgi:hypothetical protein
VDDSFAMHFATQACCSAIEFGRRLIKRKQTHLTFARVYNTWAGVIHSLGFFIKVVAHHEIFPQITLDGISAVILGINEYLHLVLTLTCIS